MPNPTHVAILRDGGVEEFNLWRSRNPLIVPDLSDADFSDTFLANANFTYTRLAGAILAGADLSGASLLGADIQFARCGGTRGLDDLYRSGAINIVLADYGATPPKGVPLRPNHSGRLVDKDLSGYECCGYEFRGAQLSGFNLSKAVFQDCILTAADLSECKLHRADLRWCELQKVNFTKADLTYANLTYANLTHACLRWADMRHADVRIAEWTGADLHSADLRGVQFQWTSEEPDLFRARNYIFIYCGEALAQQLRLEPDAAARDSKSVITFPAESAHVTVTPHEDSSLHNERLYGKSLAGYDLSGLTLEDVDLSGWDLSNARFERTRFVRADLRGCKLDGAHLVEAVLRGSKLSNSSLRKTSLNGADLQESDLTGAVLTDAVLDGAELRNANFLTAELSGARLSGTRAACARFVGAVLRGCTLSGADLRGADLTAATLDESDCTYANLSNAVLVQASLRDIKMAHADVSDANLAQSNIQGADFRHVQGLLPIAVKTTCNYRIALFDEEMLIALNVPDPEKHNDRVRSRDWSHVDLSGCDLKGVDLTGAHLENTMLAAAKLDNSCLKNADLRNANLDGASLIRADLQEADLTQARLTNAKLDWACLNKAKLVHADCRNASLVGASFQQADVTGLVLRDAILEAADLETAVGLYSHQLAATKLTAAKLPPELGAFNAVKNIEGITTNARGLVLATVLLCAYAAVQTVSVTDADLLVNRSILSSPLLDMRAPVLFFCYGCPLLLFVVYIWTHFYLQHLWEELSELPAVFQDGRAVYKKIYPWFLNAFVSAHFPILKYDRPLLTHVQIGCTVAITWWLVPVTILLLWGKYLSCHDHVGTGIQVTVLSVSISSAAFLQYRAGATLRGEERRRFKLYRPSALQQRIGIVLVPVLVSLALWSWVAINGCQYSTRGQSGLRYVVSGLLCRLCVQAKIQDADVSTKGQGWRGEERALVAGARLAGRDLRRASAKRAFLARAMLRGAHLDHGDFSGADFRWANLEGAHLQFTDLSEADFHDAILKGADVTGANLTKADLRGINLDELKGLTSKQRSEAKTQ